MRSRTRSVIFDLDGVLLHSEEIHAAAYHAVLAEVGVSDFVYADYSGVRTDEVFERVFARAGRAMTAADVARCVAQKRELARQALERRTPIAPDAAQVLSILAPEYRLFLATSASRSTLDIFLRASGTKPLFDGALCGEDVVHGKPDPEIYRRALASLGSTPEDAVVVEDAPLGIAAATGASIRTIGLVAAFDSAALLRAGASVVVAALGELPNALSAFHGP
jgi:HAD superfamily hydrolase (TIGR01509 family)